MDKSGANYASLANINLLLILAVFATMIEICQVWFGYFFDKSMVLFDNIIQIFNLAYLDHSGKYSQD
jgi:hypothetical protein